MPVIRIKYTGVELNQPDPKDKFDLAKHRRELIAQAQKRLQNKKNKNPKDHRSKKNYSKNSEAELKSLKKQLNAAQKRNTFLQKENSRLKNINHSKQKELQKLRTEKAEFNAEIEKVKALQKLKEQELEQKIALKEQKTKKLSQISLWLKDNQLNFNDDIHKIIDQRTKLLELMVVALQLSKKQYEGALNTKNNALNNYHQAKEKLKKSEYDYKHLTKLNEKLSKELSLAKKRHKSLQEFQNNKSWLINAAPAELIQILNKKCVSEDIPLFTGMEALIKKYQNTIDQRLNDKKQRKYSYGYLEIINEQNYILHDINENSTYPVNIPSELAVADNLEAGIVVRCRYNDLKDIWEIDHLYPSLSVIPSEANSAFTIDNVKKKKEVSKSNNHEIKIVNQFEVNWLKKQRITLVGNKYSKKFLRGLKRYCHVEVFDAYEDGEERIFKAMHAADYVFLLVGSVPHTITEYTKQTLDLNPTSKKVQIFNVPAKYDGVIRLHYLYANRTSEDFL